MEAHIDLELVRKEHYHSRIEEIFTGFGLVGGFEKIQDVLLDTIMAAYHQGAVDALKDVSKRFGEE